MSLSVDFDPRQKDMLWGLCKGNDCQMLRKMLLIVSLTEPETSFVKLFHPKNAIDSTYSWCSDTDCQFPAFEHRTILSAFCSCPSALSLLLCKEETMPLLMIRVNVGGTSGDGRAYMLLEGASLWSSLSLYAFGNGLHSHPFVFRAGSDCDVESSRACYCSCRIVSCRRHCCN